MGFTVSVMIPAGTVWYYDDITMSNAYGSWSSLSGSFSLSNSGDQLFVYTGSDQSPTLLFGLTTTAWLPEGSTVTSATSVLPTALMANGSDGDMNAYVEFIDDEEVILMILPCGMQVLLKGSYP